jgi:hypothetical protein
VKSTATAAASVVDRFVILFSFRLELLECLLIDGVFFLSISGHKRPYVVSEGRLPDRLLSRQKNSENQR